jgi:hypothetical protein
MAAPYRPDLKGRQRAAFHRANPASFGRAQGDAAAVRQLGQIQARSSAIKDRARAHYRRFEESWVAREAISLWQKRAGFTDEHPAPEGAPGKYVAHSIMTQARRNVRARLVQRLTRVNAVKTRMENAVVRNRPRQTQDLQTERPEPLPAVLRRRTIKP